MYLADNYDGAILDIMMPKMDGYGVTREIRRTSDVPIIILTALGDVSERITGLELGADDYVIKPFSPKELEARVKAVLRRTISKDVIIPSSSSSASGSAALHLRKSGGTMPADYHNSHNHTGPSLYNFPSNIHAYPRLLFHLRELPDRSVQALYRDSSAHAADNLCHFPYLS